MKNKMIIIIWLAMLLIIGCDENNDNNSRTKFTRESQTTELFIEQLNTEIIEGTLRLEEEPMEIIFEADQIIVTLKTGKQLAFTYFINSSNNVVFTQVQSKDDSNYSIDSEGNLRIKIDSHWFTVPVHALPDSKIVKGEEEDQILLLTDPTKRYAHRVLGDSIEAKSFTIIDFSPRKPKIRTYKVPKKDVIEGLGAIWTDWDLDGTQEIVVTLSNQEEGARLALYNEKNELLAEGPSVGKGNRWRHQLTIKPFGPNKELELVETLTPHIGGEVGYYRWNKQGRKLERVASTEGYSTHDIGSRNLDQFAAVDFDEDGQYELIVPDQMKNELAILQRKIGGIKELSRWPLRDQLTTNIAASTQLSKTTIAVGTKDNVLKIWLIK